MLAGLGVGGDVMNHRGLLGALPLLPRHIEQGGSGDQYRYGDKGDPTAFSDCADE